MIGKNLVIGGYDHVDNNKGMLYVGRLLYQFNYRIGSVTGYLNNAYFKYIIDRREQKDDFFEVLGFQEDNIIESRTLCPNCPMNDYYWKEYLGDIPEDALGGGFDNNGQQTYVGQAYVHNLGVFITNINSKDGEVNIAAYGHKTAKKNIKILCTNNPDVFQWLPSSSKTYKTDSNEFNEVIGGYDKLGNGDLVIGRAFYQGLTYVGSITPFKTPQLWFVHHAIERPSDLYQVLTYNTSLLSDP